MSRRNRLQFIVVNCVTGTNLVLGLLSVIAVANDQLTLAAGLLLTCALVDGLDGPLARRWDVSTDFGAQFDSLADMTSFIVAGGALAYFWADPADTSIPVFVAAMAAGAYVLAGAIRLARYNSSPGRPGYFQGMPTTVVSSIVAITLLTHKDLRGYGVVLLVLLLSALMVSVFPYPRLSALLPRLPRWVYLLLLAAVLISGYRFQILWLGTLTYILTGPIISVRYRLASRSR